jgi:hypothetical protein
MRVLQYRFNFLLGEYDSASAVLATHWNPTLRAPSPQRLSTDSCLVSDLAVCEELDAPNIKRHACNLLQLCATSCDAA